MASVQSVIIFELEPEVVIQFYASIVLGVLINYHVELILLSI